MMRQKLIINILVVILLMMPLLYSEEKDQTKKTPVVTGYLIHVKDNDFLVKVNIQKGWYIYGPELSHEFLIPTSFALAKDSPAELTGLEFPKAKEKDLLGETVKVYQDSLVIKAQVAKVEKGSEIVGNLKYQTCNGKTCLMPATLTLNSQKK